MDKLIYYYHTPSKSIGSRIFTHSNQRVLLDALSNHFDIGFLQHTPYTLNENNEIVDEILSKNVKFISLGSHYPVYLRVLHFVFIKMPKVFKIINTYDYLFLRGPSPLLPFLLASKPKRRIVVYFVAEYSYSHSNVNNIKSGLIFIYYKIYNYIQYMLLRRKNVLLCTNSIEIQEKLKKRNFESELIYSTTLTESSFTSIIETRRISNKGIINILFSGRIIKEKGVKELAEAVISLNNKKHFSNSDGERSPVRFVLNICGNADDSYFVETVKLMFLNAGQEKNFIFHGFLKIDDFYFSLFRKSDIFILPTYQEGFPRVLWEAMASKLPIITTNVGAIPYILKHNESAMIIEPRNNKLIEESILCLIENPEIVSTITNNAFQIAKTNTIEISASKLAAYVKK